MVALVYNWWTLFVRLAQPHKHFEAISSRPLLLHGVATHTQHAGQTRLTITSLHAKQSAIQAVLTNLAGFLSTLKTTAEQWTDAATATRDSHPRVRQIHAPNSEPSGLADLRNCGDLTR